MGGILGGGSTIASSETAIGGFQVQTSCYGKVVPVLFGRNRLPANLIYYTDFQQIAHTTSQTSGGKGGGVTTTNTTYTYQASVILAFCEGPVTLFGNLYVDKLEYTNTVWPSSPYNYAQFLGSYTQTPWSYVTSKHPTEALPYVGLAYLACANLQLTGSATLQNHSLEIVGLAPFNTGSAIWNANVADIINGVLTSSTYGIGFPTAYLQSLGTSSQAYKYSAAQGIFFGAAFLEQRPTRDWLSNILSTANMDFVWSENILKTVPYGDTNVSGNGYTYTANVTPVYDLDSNDFLPWSGGTSLQPNSEADDPVQLIRRPLADVHNQVQIEWVNAARDYNVEIYTAKDQSHIEAYGLRPADPIKAHWITDLTTAQTVARLMLQRELWVRNQYRFRLSWKYCRLEPVIDLVTLTEAGLGLDKKTVRIIEINEDSGGALTVTAEEWPFGTANPSLYGSLGGSGSITDQTVDPGASQSCVFMMPPQYFGGKRVVAIACSGGSVWGGANIWLSFNNVDFKQVGVANGKARFGQMISGGTWSTGSLTGVYASNTMRVDFTTSQATLLSGSTTDRDNLTTLCVVLTASGAKPQLFSYTTATLLTTYTYELANVYLGAFNSSPIVSPAVGDKVVRLDDALVFVELPDSALDGSTIYFKIQAFNIYGQGTQLLSSLTPVSMVIPAANLATWQVGANVSTPSLATSLTKPTGATSTTIAMLSDDGEGSVDSGGVVRQPTWVDISWSYNEAKPMGALQGFEVILYKGSSAPAVPGTMDVSQFIAPPMRVPPTTRRFIKAFPMPAASKTGISYVCAVRPIFPWSRDVEPETSFYSWQNTAVALP